MKKDLVVGQLHLTPAPCPEMTGPPFAFLVGYELGSSPGGCLGVGQVKEVLPLDHRGLRLQFASASPVQKQIPGPHPKDSNGVHLRGFK